MKMEITTLALLMGIGSASGAWAGTPAQSEKGAKVANADTAGKSDKTGKDVKPAKMTCEEFLELDDVARPKIVYWAEGFNKKGKADDAIVDVETTDRLVPMVVDVCKTAPKESFLKKTKEQSKSMKTH